MKWVLFTGSYQVIWLKKNNLGESNLVSIKVGQNDFFVQKQELLDLGCSDIGVCTVEVVPLNLFLD